MDGSWTPETITAEFARLRGNIDNTRDILEKYLRQMDSTMKVRFNVEPVGAAWVEEEGEAKTPRGIGPSINYRRLFADGYEVVFYTRSGVFIVNKEGAFAEEFWTRY